MSPNNTRSQTPMPKVTAHLSIWGVPTILDTSSDLRGCVHARAAEEVQSAVQGRSRADGARDRQADRRGRSRPGNQRGHPRQLDEHLAPRESGADNRTDSGGACACEGNGRRDPPAADGKRVPKKSGGLLRADATVAERCALIHAEKDTYDITFMCALLRVPRSSYYAWTHRAETPTQARRRALAVEVAAEFTNSRQTSGCRRIAAALNRRGTACSVGLVADLMRELGLAAVQPRAYKRTTLPGDAPTPAPDLLSRDFTATVPGARLVGDITYLRPGDAAHLRPAGGLEHQRPPAQGAVDLQPRTGQDLGLRRPADRRRTGRDLLRAVAQQRALAGVSRPAGADESDRNDRGDHRQPLQSSQPGHPGLADRAVVPPKSWRVPYAAS